MIFDSGCSFELTTVTQTSDEEGHGSTFPPTEQNEAKISWMGVLPCGLDDIISGSGAALLCCSQLVILLAVREAAESTETLGIQMRVKSVSVTFHSFKVFVLIKAGFSLVYLCADVHVIFSLCEACVDLLSWL